MPWSVCCSREDCGCAAGRSDRAGEVQPAKGRTKPVQEKRTPVGDLVTVDEGIGIDLPVHLSTRPDAGR